MLLLDEERTTTGGRSGEWSCGFRLPARCPEGLTSPDYSLCDAVYRALDAPRGKHFIWFEDAAHMIPYEAPDEYADVLVHRVLKETREGGRLFPR